MCVCGWQPRDVPSWVDRDRGRTFSAQKKVRRRSFARSTSMLSQIPRLFCIGMTSDKGVRCRKSVVPMLFIIPNSKTEDLVNWRVEVKRRSCSRGYELCKPVTLSTLFGCHSLGDNTPDDYSPGTNYSDTCNWETLYRWRSFSRQHMIDRWIIGLLLNRVNCMTANTLTRSIWKMLGPFATTSRLTPIHQMSLAVLSRAACASMSMTTTPTTTMRDKGDRYGPMEWAQ